MAWPHGRYEFLIILATSLVNLASSSVLQKHTDSGVDLCRVQGQKGLGDADASADKGLRIVALPGNTRTVAFGQGLKDTETTVQCVSQDGKSSEALPAGCAAWPEDQEPVSDVSQCPACACIQDTSKGLQSESNKLLFEEGIEPACREAAADHPVDVLLFGMGGGAVHTYAMKKCPSHTRVESVEADPRMAAVATKFFGVPVEKGVALVNVDTASNAAGSLAEQLNSAEGSSLEEQSSGQKKSLRRSGAEQGVQLGKKRWDVIATDCFVDHGVTPEDCRSREFLTYLRVLVRPGGTVMQHMWHTSPYDDSVAPTFDDTVELYKDIFGQDKVSLKQVSRANGLQWDSVIMVKG